MATKLTITPQTTSLSTTNQVTTLTISSAVAGAATDAAGITFATQLELYLLQTMLRTPSYSWRTNSLYKQLHLQLVLQI